MEVCLAQTGMNMWMVVLVAIVVLLCGLAMFFCPPLRKSLGLLLCILAAGGVVSISTPVFAADGVDCNTQARPTSPSLNPSPAPSDPVSTKPGPADCDPHSEMCGDTQVRADAQGRLVACNADSNTVNEWSAKLFGYDTEQDVRQAADLDSSQPGIQYVLDKPEQGFRAVYDPDTNYLTVTVTDDSLYPQPPATCGPCEELDAPELFTSGWFQGGGDYTLSTYSNGCVSIGISYL